MNNNIYNTEETLSYLLGALPEKETLRYDELSIVDDSFNDFLRNVENDLVDSYINGGLDASVLKQFESFYMATPKRREKIAFARAFYHHADRDPTTEPAARPLQAVSGPSFWEKLRFGLTPAWLSFAAIALICVIGALWFVSTGRIGTISPEVSRQAPANVANASNGPVVAVLSPTAQPLPSVAETKEPANSDIAESKPTNKPEPVKTPVPEPRVAPVVATFVLSPPLRGAEQLRTLSISPNIGKAAFRLELEPVDYKAYKIELRDQADNKVIWSADNLKSTNQRSLGVTIPASLLHSRTYVFSVSGISASGQAEIIGDYPFKVVR